MPCVRCSALWSGSFRRVSEGPSRLGAEKTSEILALDFTVPHLGLIQFPVTSEGFSCGQNLPRRIQNRSNYPYADSVVRWVELCCPWEKLPTVYSILYILYRIVHSVLSIFTLTARQGYYTEVCGPLALRPWPNTTINDLFKLWSVCC